MTKVNFLYTTAPDEETAREIARGLLDKRLAACVNMFPGMRSVYRWNGAVEESGEVAMIVKTTDEAAPEAAALIVTLHPYETPAITSIAGDGPGASAKFADWIAGEVAAAAG